MQRSSILKPNSTESDLPVGMRPRIKVSQTELEEVIRLHCMYQAGRPGGHRALLSYRDLSGLNLVNRNLSDADLTGVLLVGADRKSVV